MRRPVSPGTHRRTDAPSRALVPAVVLALLFLLLAPSPAGAARLPEAPRSFFGVVMDGPMLSPSAPVGRELRLMHRNGLGFVRVPVHWVDLQPAPETTDLRPVDRIVRAAARAGLDVLPVVVRSPGWAASGPDLGSPPRDLTTYQAFLRTLVARYGPRGTLWDELPRADRRPLRLWQIWSEPNLKWFWSAEPWAPRYVDLLRAGRAALKAADPGARIMLGGLPNQSSQALEQLYEAGARGLFDEAAIHPYTRKVANMVRLVKRGRRVMDRHGDRGVPLALTEFGWTSGQGRATLNLGWETTERGQATKLREALTSLAEHRRELGLRHVAWYTWLSPRVGPSDSFAYSGLRRQTGRGTVSKPALRTLRTTLRRLTR